MAEGVHLSFHLKGPNEILIAFDRAGAEHLIAKIRATIEDGDHLHDFMPNEEEVGWLTRKRPWATEPESKIMAIQYQFEEDLDDWVD